MHDGDREKASSILKNLVYMPVKDLGKFKYIFSEKLRSQFFERVDKKMLDMKDESKLGFGQISKEEVGDILKFQEHLKVIEVLWSFKEKRRESMSPRANSPVFNTKSNKRMQPLEDMNRRDFVTTLLEVFQEEEHEE